jgi:hypothetical protein
MNRKPLEDWAQYSQRLEREIYAQRDQIRHLRTELDAIKITQTKTLRQPRFKITASATDAMVWIVRITRKALGRE